MFGFISLLHFLVSVLGSLFLDYHVFLSCINYLLCRSQVFLFYSSCTGCMVILSDVALFSMDARSRDQLVLPRSLEMKRYPLGRSDRNYMKIRILAETRVSTRVRSDDQKAFYDRGHTADGGKSPQEEAKRKRSESNRLIKCNLRARAGRPRHQR